MASHTINISDDVRSILLNVADRLGLPPDIEEDEQLSIAIDAIANSIDTAMEVATSAEGTPLQMQDALEAVLNPHIGTVFVQPTTAAKAERTLLSWEDIVAIMKEDNKTLGLYNDNTLVDQYDAPSKEAICLIFNQLPQDEWSSEHAEKMIDQTIAILRGREEKAGSI